MNAASAALMSFTGTPTARAAAVAASAFAMTCFARPPNEPGSSATSMIDPLPTRSGLGELAVADLIADAARPLVPFQHARSRGSR